MSDWQQVLVNAGDVLLGWTLHLQRDFCLLVVAVLAVAVLLLIRCIVGDRSALRQLSADERRNRELSKAATANGSQEDMQRLRHLRRRLSIHRLQQEFWPLLVGVLPALLILTWGSKRLQYLPLRENEPFELQLELTASAIGELVHVVPDDTLTCESTWIQTIEASPESDSPGNARWILRADTVGEVPLQIRHRTTTFVHPIEVGTTCYREAEIHHEGGVTTRIGLEAYHPLGVVPELAGLGLSAWLVGFLLITIPLFLTVRRLLRLA